MKSLFWLIDDVFLQFFGGIGYFLITFFLWENGKSLHTIIVFNLVIFISLIIANTLAGALTHRLGTKFIFSISIIIRSITLLTAFIFSDTIAQNIVLIGVLVGIYSGFSFSVLNLLTRSIIPEDKTFNYYSNRQIFSSILSILSPIATGLLIKNFGYQHSFLIVLFGLIVLIAIFLFIPFEKKHYEFYFHKLLMNLFKDVNLQSILKISFSLGVTYVLSWGLLDVLVLENLGNLDNWSTVKVGMAITAIMLSLILKKIKVKDSSKIIGIIAITSLIYAVIPILMLNRFNVGIFIIFSFAQLIFSTIATILTNNYIYTFIDSNEKSEERIISYQMFMDVFKNLGQLIPILILFLAPADLVTSKNLILFISFITLTPLLFIGALKKISKSPFS